MVQRIVPRGLDRRSIANEILVFALLAGIMTPASAQTGVVARPDDPSAESVRSDLLSVVTLTRLSMPGPLAVGAEVLEQDPLRVFYASRGYRLAWDAPGSGLGPRAAAVLATLRAAEADGLDPADYHVDEIMSSAAAATASDRVDRDMLISDGLLRYINDVTGGKLTPLQTDERPDARRGRNPLDCLMAVSALAPDALSIFLDGLPPATSEYRALKAMLANLRTIADAGGWEAIPDGGSIRPGARDIAVPALRQRLIAEGWLPARRRAVSKSAEPYDSTLAAAVAKFQAAHGIKPDGVVGDDTRAALNLPVEVRLQQAVVNLERARWEDIPPIGRMIEVNLAGFSLKVYQDGLPTMTMPVVVGTRQSPTPILSSSITSIVLNPTWTVPPIVIKELLPKLQQDPRYLTKLGIERRGEPGHIRLVQPAGPRNPLGHYKFVIATDQDIYLHDSPDARKFHYAIRDYSHGCVRLSNASALAALLLDAQIDKLPAGLNDLVQLGTTRHVRLLTPVPVSLIYRTAWLNAEGRLVMGADSYGRDQKLWSMLHKTRPPAPPRATADRVSSIKTL